MKNIIILFIAFSIIMACHKKAVPVVATSPDHPVYTAADIEAGKVVYETKCARCHAVKPVGNYTATRWVGILKAMIPRSKLDSIQKLQVTAYVNTNAKKE